MAWATAVPLSKKMRRILEKTTRKQKGTTQRNPIAANGKQ
jgi:hypothetical protein